MARAGVGLGLSREGQTHEVLQHVGAQRRVHLLPAAQVGNGLVQQVTVARQAAGAA